MAEHTTAAPDAVVDLWASACAAQHAAAVIAARDGVDTDLRFTTAASYCGEAADEIQRARPVLAGADVAALAADVEGLPTAEASDHLSAAIAASIAAFDLDDPRLLPIDVLAAGAAANWLAMAHHALSGRLP
jgi:hypothetical protein